MEQETFEKYLNAIARSVNAKREDGKKQEAFDRGYAFGKILGRTMLQLTDREKVEFQNGMQDGIEIEQIRKENLH